MRSRCSGVSGGNESTMARTYSASTGAGRSRVAGSVLLGGGSCAVWAGCLREGGRDLGESVASICGAVVVGCACSALFRVLSAPGSRFEFLGFLVRCFFLFSGQSGVVGGFPTCLGPTSASRAGYASRLIGESVGFGCRVGAGFIGHRSIEGCPDVRGEVAAHPSWRAVVGRHVVAGRPTSQLAHSPGEQAWLDV